MQNSDTFHTYYKAVANLESIFNVPQQDYMVPTSPKGRSLYLKRFSYFLKQIDNPHKSRGLKYIHVGGSSGKGSVTMMLHSILTDAGYTVGSFTSPFPTTTIEKFKIGNTYIDPKEFAVIYNQLKPAIDKTYINSPYGRPSYFEICTAIAFLYFKRHKCDYAILEVGLGGRFDSTNVIPTPKITIINSISKDHTELLGNTLTEIAKEKAGIIKRGTILLTGANPPKIVKLFHQQCKKVGAKFVQVLPTDTYKLSLAGDFQQHNAALAAAAAERLGVDEAAIASGLQRTTLPCRFEIIQKKPMVILDGAHNPAKVKTVVENLKNLTHQKLFLIIALTNERKPTQVLGKLVKQADSIWCTRYQNNPRKAFPPKIMAQQLKKHVKGKKIVVTLDPRNALNQALKQAGQADIILITGSMYLAGELRTKWVPEQRILERRRS